jgi:hypothetical protein
MVCERRHSRGDGPRSWPPAIVRRATIAAALLLAACGNFREHVEIGTWEHIDTQSIPRDTFPGVRLTVVANGNDREIAEGDLVQMRVVRYAGSGGDAPFVRDTLTLWIWTGWQGRYEEWGEEFGDLGDPSIRRALIGIKIGSELRIDDDTSARFRHTSVVPRYGILPVTSWWRVGGQERTTLAGGYGGDARWWSEATLLQSCPGTLFRRTTVITQWGYVWGPGTSYPPSRRGELYAGGLLGRCAPPTGTIWLTSGMHYASGMHGGNAYNAFYTMQSVHPASRFPEDWWDPAKGVPAIIPKDVLEPPPTPVASEVEQRGNSRTEGAERAMNEGFTDPKQCRGTPEFVAGCTAAIMRMKRGPN